MHAVLNKVCQLFQFCVIGFVYFGNVFAVFSCQLTANIHSMRIAFPDVVNQHETCFHARGNGAFMGQAVSTGSVNGCHADCVNGRNAVFNGKSHGVVDMASFDNVCALLVVRAEKTVCKSMAVYRREQINQIMGGRAFAQKHIHAAAYAFQRFFNGGAFMVSGNSCQSVHIQIIAVHHGSVSVDNFIMFCGKFQFFKNFFVLHEYAGHIHHFSKPEHIFVRNEFGKVKGGQIGAGIFKRQGRHAGRKHNFDVEQTFLCIFQHEAYAVQTFDVGYFVRVGNDGSRAERNNQLGKFIRAEHGRFNMDMGIKKRGQKAGVFSVHNLLSGHGFAKPHNNTLMHA